MPTGRIVNQADLARRLREAFKRIRILEARSTGGGGSGGGDYVFLSETVLDADVSQFSIEGIPQGYRHLVAETSLIAAGSGSTSHDFYLRWEEDVVEYSSGQIDFNISGVGPQGRDTPVTGGNGVDFWHLLPRLGTFEEGLVMFTNVTMKFPYYSRVDRVKGVHWQADGVRNDGGGVSMFVASGSGQALYDTEGGEASAVPIETLTFYQADGDWAAGCRVSLYGIT